MSKYIHLFQPTQVGKCFIKNRIAMAPMNDLHQFYDPIEGTVNRRWIDYFSERAKGGVGLIITGVFKVEDDITHFRQNGFSTWALLSKKSRQNYAELAKYVHTFGGRIFMQISAGPGRVMGGASIDQGFVPISSSENQAYFRPEKSCRPIRTDEVAKLVEAFADASELVASAGIDGVEIHGHEGYLIDQFATALWNRRKDKYGGDLEGRLTFAKEILAAIKEKVGQDFPVMYRYGSKHFIRAPLMGTLRQNEIELGRDISESIQMARILERSGYDALHVDAGCYESAYWAHPPMYFPDGPMIELTKQIKSAVKIPVIAVGRLGDPEFAEKVLTEGKADMIALGRDLLSDPHWPHKAQWARVEDIRRCIGCHECMYRAENGQYLTCAINPFCGNEGVVNIKRSTEQKKVAVIGGGIAGMEAARVASLKGYDVTLYEKNQELGGHAIAGGVPTFKRDIRVLLDWYKARMKDSKIKVEMKVEVTEEMLAMSHPDSIIVATGSIPRKPDIPGVNGSQVHHCIDVLLGKSKVAGATVVIGGGVLGCEAGLWLAQQGIKVTIVDMLPQLANDIHRSNKAMLIQLLEDNGATLIARTRIVRIESNGVIAVNDRLQTSLIECKSVVLALGLAANNGLHQSLARSGIEAYAIGDCVQPRKIADAIWEANMLLVTV